MVDESYIRWMLSEGFEVRVPYVNPLNPDSTEMIHVTKDGGSLCGADLPKSMTFGVDSCPHLVLADRLCSNCKAHDEAFESIEPVPAYREGSDE